MTQTAHEIAIDFHNEAVRLRSEAAKLEAIAETLSPSQVVDPGLSQARRHADETIAQAVARMTPHRQEAP